MKDKSYKLYYWPREIITRRIEKTTGRNCVYKTFKKCDNTYCIKSINLNIFETIQKYVKIK